MNMMKTVLFVLACLCAGGSAHAQLAGKLDLASMPALGAWQSLKSAEQAIGISKRVWHLDKDEQVMINVGLFGGSSSPLFSEPNASPRALGGVTLAVPGSILDWALGTSYGDTWLPKLKTGLLCAYDVSRPKSLKAVPDFVGLGIAWPLAGM